MANILIIYSTTDGHTLGICQRLKQVIAQENHRVSLIAVDDAANTNMGSFDKIVIGASIRYGKHSAKVYELIIHNRSLLERKPCAFFSVNLVARKAEKCQPDTNPYMRKFLKQIAWQPQALAVFAGRIDYRLYSFWDRQIIRLIMLITHGPIQADAAIEYTNWDAVAAFGKRIADL